MKTLFSFMIEKDVLKKLKNIPDITAAELVRNSIDFYLDKRQTSIFRINRPIEVIFYELKNNMPLSIEDYVSLLTKLDNFYTGKNITCLSDEETVLFAFCTAEILLLTFTDSNISNHPAKYFTDYFCVDQKYDYILSRVNFVELIGFLHLQEGQKIFNILGLIRILEVYLRDKVSKNEEQKVFPYLQILKLILIKLTKHFFIEDEKKIFSDLPQYPTDEKTIKTKQIDKEDLDKIYCTFSDDDFSFLGNLYVVDKTIGRFYLEVKDKNCGYATLSLAQWVDMIAFIKDPKEYQPKHFLYVKSRNDFMMEWRYPFMVGNFEKFQDFVLNLIQTEEYKNFMNFVYEF